MEATDQVQHIDTRQPKQRERISLAELFTALEGLLPLAQVEVNCLNDDLRDTPADAPDYPETAVRAHLGKEAIELANRLIARKTAVIRRKQRQLGKQQDLQQELEDAAAAEKSVAVDE